ncbi:translation initiation factor IF-2 [Roseofilum casamattae]|uniref:Translation initiation factor IF-2 n=1 Tax=Roseofilum casamattae BLCC-M143 TaxID=3022442 RepID=A0ABT7C2B0_9CYAN|nr:translation initiation factor IF-2 [Roseofilum casamattae]MDJ1185420.1 translation initiation factor IF-2 [Roseofilum casamattae BLCC-M143]
MNNGKVRIYELSKELNLENHYVLTLCDRLNIAYKSHSSTISEAEAEQIRAYASEHPPDKTTHHRSKPQLANSAPIKKKPQILEIHRKKGDRDSGRSSSRSDTATIDAQERSPLQSPPRRPAAPTEPSQPQSTLQKPDISLPQAEAPSPPVGADLPAPSVSTIDTEAPPIAQSAAPPKTDSQEQSPSTPKSPVARQTTSIPTTAEPAPSKQLIGPPSRPVKPSRNKGAASVPAASKGEGSHSTNSVPTKPGKPSGGKSPKPPRLRREQNERPQKSASPSESGDGKKAPVVKPVLAREGSKSDSAGPARKQQRTPQSAEVAASSNKPRKPKPEIISHKEKSADSLRPRPVRPAAGSPSSSDEEYDVLASPEMGIETEQQEPGTLELKRPTLRPTKKVKKYSQEEEEEETGKQNKSGKGAGKKRRPQIIEDDLDDDLDDLDDGEQAAEVSLSLARPAKPKSMAVAAKPAATASTKKRSSGNRDRNRSRRGGNKPAEKVQRPEIITLTGELMVRDLAEMLVVPETDVVKSLFYKGIAATVTQTLDLETATWVARELGVEVETPEAESDAKKVTQMLAAEDLENLNRRPPVVTIMGHVDHGKTTLLDAIRQTKVAASEAGGITQHIGAYHVDVEHDDKVQQVVFLDTPGHEAFTAMRARGTRVTDIAILVVAADDGVRPQTIEAIGHAKAAEVPIVVAINKIDKEGASPDRVKQELMEHGLVPEEWGGDAIMVPVSAIQGENLDTLLEMLLLVSEIEELSANPDRLAKGTIIEAHLDKARGPVATFLVQNGTLRIGDSVVAGACVGKVRAMVDDRGERVEEALPSFAVEVLGLSEVPSAGDEFESIADEREAKALANSRAQEQRESRLQQALASRRVTLSNLSSQAAEGELKELNLILKGDVQGSVEAILGSLQQLPQNEVQLRILLASAGEVTETDVDLAAASNAVIIAFNTTFASGARATADRTGVDVREYDIIYNLLDDIEGAMEGLLDPEMVEESLGTVEVRAVFAVGKGSVAGCYIQSGKAIRNCNIRIQRGRDTIYEGFLDSLRRERDDVKEVNSGFECGVGVDKFTSWQVGDLIHTYRMVTKRRTLSS